VTGSRSTGASVSALGALYLARIVSIRFQCHQCWWPLSRCSPDWLPLPTASLAHCPALFSLFCLKVPKIVLLIDLYTSFLCFSHPQHKVYPHEAGTFPVFPLLDVQNSQHHLACSRGSIYFLIFLLVLGIESRAYHWVTSPAPQYTLFFSSAGGMNSRPCSC
jgi:hypothetical protein